MTTFLCFLGREKVSNTAISGASSARNRNAILMAVRWHDDDGPTLHADLETDFQGIRISIAKKPYIFVVFQGGQDPVPPLDPRV